MPKTIAELEAELKSYESGSLHVGMPDNPAVPNEATQRRIDEIKAEIATAKAAQARVRIMPVGGEA